MVRPCSPRARISRACNQTPSLLHRIEPLEMRVLLSGDPALLSPAAADPGSGVMQPAASTLTLVTIAGPTQVNKLTSTQYTLTATYSNGSTANVTSTAGWSIDSPYANISAGLLSTWSVPFDQPCRITATYGGLTDTHDITIKNASTTSAVDVSVVTPVTTQTLDWGGSTQYIVTVLNSAKNPVSGATVSVLNGLAGGSSSVVGTTNSAGQVTFAASVPNNLAIGDYALVFSAAKSGYRAGATMTSYVQVSHPLALEQPFPDPNTPAGLPGRVEAENYDSGGEGVGYHDTEAANLGGQYRPSEGVDVENSSDGGGYDVAWAQAGEWLKYTVNVSASGYYEFDERLASSTAGGRFHIEVDGVNVTGAVVVPATGGWQTWQTISQGNISLTAGQHVLKLVMDTNSTTGFVANFNWLQAVVPTELPYPTPATPANVPGIIQAENFDSGGESLAYHDTTAGNLGGAYRTGDWVDIETTTDIGGGYDVGWTAAGEWLKYTVNAPAAGTYQLDERIAAPVAGGQFHVEVDGVDVTGPITVPSTGGWQAWQTLTQNGISLTAGQHVIRLALDANNASGYIANFNWLQFRGGPELPYPDPNAPAAIPGTIEVENYDSGGESVGYHDADYINVGGAYRPSEGVDLEATTDPTGGGYDMGWVRAGEWLRYTVNMPTAGAYTIGFRVACNGAGGTFHLECDGTNVTGSLTVPNTSGWQTWQTLDSASVALPAGQHVLTLVMDSAAGTYVGNFNYITFTGPIVASPASASVAQIGDTIQAENYNPGGEGVGYHDTTAGNLGGQDRPSDGVDIQVTGDAAGGYNVGWTAAGEWLAYTLNVATGGAFTLQSRIAAPSAGGSFHVEFGGADLTGPIAMPATGGWQSWQTLSTPGITLTAGAHTMRVVMDRAGASGYVGNVNWFRLA